MDFTLAPGAPGEYVGQLDTTQLTDGTQTLVVVGRKGSVTQQALVDVVVRNGVPAGRVSRSGTEFILDGKPLRYLGWNRFNLPFLYDRTLKTNELVLVQASEDKHYPIVLPKGSVLTFQEQVDREMLEARRFGLQVVRTWGYRTDGLDSGDWFSRVNLAGTAMEFNEVQFRKFDYVLDSAQRHGIKVVIVLQNYWTDFGGIKVTMEQLGSDSRNRFFVDPTAKRLFKEYIAYFVARQNSINGRRYADDPAIFSWELMNEPRMDGTYEQDFWDRDGRVLGGWLREMGSYLRSLDHTHLIASGAEGHPFQGWGLINEGFGSDPLPVIDQPDIDYFTLHIYPNGQQFRMTREYATGLLTDFVRATRARGKPVVMEEWGFDAQYSMKNAAGVDIEPDAPSYPEERLAWATLLLSAFHSAGGNGSHLWGFQTSTKDRVFGVNVYSPAPWVRRDRPFVTLLQKEAHRMGKKEPH